MIRVLIADDAVLIRSAIRTLLEQEDDLFVAGCARTIEEMCYLLPQSDIVLILSALDGATPLDVVSAARESGPEVKIIVGGLSQDAALIIRYIEAGADGYVLQADNVAALLAQTRAVHEDEALVSPRMAACLMDRVTELAQQTAPLAQLAQKTSGIEALTPREIDVLELVEDGLTNREIAAELVISPGTAKNHVHNILRKIDVDDRHQAAAVYDIYCNQHDVLAATVRNG